ncbi:carboxypeptidase regulatory-like domain-containing protein [Alloacidobacterium dinghuense]|uniref:Carboxypeptidase regulatory-like domain-containing protein n=1 Tax=Alloacidobacterium dinghuense TaxID=2763107 RepID=A0A7G8BEK9_9BACT|nr:carboxypeptidase regulatory-like domain-containing protein [Alloacidobacterium dinghuense]QNI30979.1 carboxypeptidase regulatory-like domain-containing protein [Alloacidobacterium dinghuense]
MKHPRSWAWYRYTIALAVIAFLGSSVNAQVNTASLSGLITDPSGAAVPNVTVNATSPATGYARVVTTDNAGYYTFQNLPIGQYTVRVEAPGFTTDQENVTLNVAEKGRRDFSLQVGSEQQTVQVEAQGIGLSPDDASIGTVVDSRTIEQTPLYLRNWDDLLRTVPGVQISRFTQQSGSTSAGRTGDFNVNGIHSLQNNFILDGIDNNTFSENVQELSTESAHPSVDVIAEFNIITNPYSAEYGRAPGAAVSVNTRSGTNQFHGLAYEYVRNQYFDATDFITKQHNQPKAENNQNQFGGSFGGPILKNRLFGFFNYEGTRIKQGVNRTSTVPLDNERIGDFSPETSAKVGIKYPTIYDPQTGQPFADNKIPAGRIDPVVASLIALFPEPNVASNGSFAETNNYFRTGGVQDNNDSYNGRVDWTASQNDTVFARYNYSNRFRFIPGYFGGLADGSSTSAWGRQYLKNHSLVIGWTHVFSASMVNDFRFGWVRNYSFAEQDPFALTEYAGNFVPGIPINPAVGGGVPLTTFSGSIGAFVGSPDFLPKQQVPQQFQYNDTLSITHGRQTYKIGASLYAPMRNLFQDEPGMRGDMTFTGIFTCERNASSQCISNTGFPYADGLLGQVQSNQLTNVHFVDQRIWMLSGFFEDDWKVTPKLTLNLGLRYDFATPALNAKNQMANFDPDSGSLVFARSGSLKSRSLVDTNYKNFGPRLGFAYSPDQKTVVRGGYGIYYTVFERYGSEDQLSLNPPFLINKTQSAASTSTTPAMIAQQGFPSNYLDPSTINLNNLTSFHIRALNSNDPTPYVQQWSFGIQRAIANTWTAEVDYVGTKSTHLDIIRDYNQPIISGNTVQTTTNSSGKTVPVIPYSNFGQIEYTDPIGFGNYNGLQASLKRRFQAGLSLQAAYTYSHSLDNAPEELESNSGDAPNGRNAAAWYGNSDFDIRNRVSVSYVYELPFGHGKSMLNSGPLSWIFGDFRTSGVYTFYSGHPFTVNSGGTLASALDPYGYAVATPFVVGKPRVIGDPACYFYISTNKACSQFAPNTTDAYVAAPAGQFGNSGRNTLIGPRTNVFDAALMRDFPIERVNLQARWEVFNVTNTPEFGQPGNNITSSSAGSITTLSGDPRVMQFALRISF